MKKNQIILIEGNMASGKTLYTKGLCDVLKLENISMDALRERLYGEHVYKHPVLDRNSSVFARESICRALLRRRLKEGGTFVWERMGPGKNDHEMDKLIRNYGYKVFRVLIACAPRECLNRYEIRPPSQVPLPEFMTDAETFIYDTNDKLAALVRHGMYQLTIDNGKGADYKSNLLELCRKVMAWVEVGEEVSV